jgi:hypothetical protein
MFAVGARYLTEVKGKFIVQDVGFGFTRDTFLEARFGINGGQSAMHDVEIVIVFGPIW